MEITFRYTRDFSVLFMVTDNKKQSYVVLMKKFVRETQLLEYIQIWLELRKREKTMIDMWAENNRADVCGRETIFFPRRLSQYRVSLSGVYDNDIFFVSCIF